MIFGVNIKDGGDQSPLGGTSLVCHLKNLFYTSFRYVQTFVCEIVWIFVAITATTKQISINILIQTAYAPD